jgi:D-amino-acid dehydrogenase
VRIVVLGAGVVGVTAAWYLAADGHEVSVVDRRSGAALETSFANGGQISASHAEPWANPRAPLQVLKWLGREDAPLLFRATTDWRQWRFGLQFLHECLPWRTRHNTIRCLALALHSRACLKALRASTGLRYDHLERGILHFYTDAKEYASAARHAELLRDYGCARDVKDVAECVAIEPALEACRDRLVGGIYTADDESGDAHRFTVELARLAAASGAVFRWNLSVEALAVDGDRIAGARCRASPPGETPGETPEDAPGDAPRSAPHEAPAETLVADAYVVSLGSYSPLLLSPIGVSCPIYPAKGYSATINVGSHRGAPTVSLTDPASKVVMSRLGDKLRVAGTAELSGYGTGLNLVRCEALVRRTFDLFPDAGEREGIAFWTGLRPAVPSNVPLVGGTRYRNLFLDTGHGTLGWTMACGSGQVLADVVAGRRPAVPFAYTRL